MYVDHKQSKGYKVKTGVRKLKSHVLTTSNKLVHGQFIHLAIIPNTHYLHL